MPPCAPHAVDQTLAVRDAVVLVALVVRGAVRGGQPEGLDMATGQADGKQRLGGMEDLCEEVGGERQRAQILEHRDSRSIGVRSRSEMSPGVDFHLRREGRKFSVFWSSGQLIFSSIAAGRCR